MRIAITTPTGNTARRLTNTLLEQGGHDLVLLARDPSKLADEEALGATVLRGDLADAAFVAEATKGSDAIFFVCPSNFTVDDYRGYCNELAKAGAAAVQANGIAHTVFLSSLGGHLPEGTGPVTGLHDGENIFSLATQGLTILRPSFFMENYLSHLDALRGANSVFMPLPGETVFPMIATADIADRAAEVITQPAPASPQIIALHGQRDLSLNEAAQIMGKATGREIQHVQVEPAQARESLIGMGMSEGVADTMLEMYAGFREGRITDVVERSAETTTSTTFETFVDSVIAPALR